MYCMYTLLLLQLAADLEPLLERRRERMSKLRAPLQPYLVFLGPQLWNITASYVAFDRVLYKVDSVLLAVDTCFKIYHSLCAGYPMEANHLWHFFHMHVYQVKHDPALEGDVPMSTSDFITKLASV